MMIFFVLSLFLLLSVTSQKMADAFERILMKGIKKGNAAVVREAISLLEAQGHDCADAKDKLKQMVQFYF